MRIIRSLHPIFLLVCIGLIAGCSGSSDPDYPIAAAAVGSESVYSAGTRVEPVTYDEAAGISLYRKGADGSFSRLANGEHLAAGTHTLAVKISEGMKGRGRVFASDGGGRQTEAVLDDGGEYHVFDWRFARDSFRQVLLIQEIYADGTASKEKFVLASDPNPGFDQLVREGMALMVGDDILAALKEPMGGLLAGMLGMEGVVLNELKPSASAGEGVINLDLTIPLGDPPLQIPIDLSADLILDDSNRKLNINLEEIKLWNSDLLGHLVQILNLFPIVKSPVALDLGEMLGGDEGDEGDDDLMGSLLGGLELDKLLFLDIYGRPADTTADFACLGAGLFGAAKSAVPSDAEGEPLFPEVSIFDLPPEFPLVVPTPVAPYNLGVSLSQYNLNQVLGAILGDLAISFFDAGIFQELIIILPANPDGSNTQALEISFNPAGLSFDLREEGMLLRIQDLRLEYVENNKPMWQMSVDSAFDLTIAAGATGPTLDLYLDIRPEFTHTHVMRDNLGILGMYDHSDFFIFIFNTLTSMLSDDPEGPLLSLDLAEFLGDDMITFKSGASPLSIDTENGNCYLGLAIESIDVGSLGGCFIQSAR